MTFKLCPSFVVAQCYYLLWQGLKFRHCDFFECIITALFSFSWYLEIIKLSNLHFHPCICNAIAFDMQWCYVIGVPRDLCSNTAIKVKSFSWNKMVIKVRLSQRAEKVVCSVSFYFLTVLSGIIFFSFLGDISSYSYPLNPRFKWRWCRMEPIKMMYGSMFVLQFFWETCARTSEEIFPGSLVASTFVHALKRHCFKPLR